MYTSSNIAAMVMCYSNFPIGISTGKSFSVARPIPSSLEFLPLSGDNTAEMLQQLDGLRSIGYAGNGFTPPVPMAVDALESLVTQLIIHLKTPPAGDVQPDGQGGAQVTWEGDNKAVILSASAMLDGGLDTFLYIENDGDYKAIRPVTSSQVAEHLIWLTATP